MIPPVVHACCGQDCFQTYDQEERPCWGNVSCVDTDYVDDGDGGLDEYRYAVCEGHSDMYPSYDKTKYIKAPE